MSFTDPTLLEVRMRAIEASCLRQLSLIGKPGYDPQLTIQLKKDLDWFISQLNILKTDNVRR
jgi:hypothetical protein